MMSLKRLTVRSGLLIGIAAACLVQSQAEAQLAAGGVPDSVLFSSDSLGHWLTAEKSEVFVPVLPQQWVDSGEKAKSGLGGPRLALAAGSGTTDVASGGLLGAADKSNSRFSGFLDALGAYTYASPAH